MKMISYIVIQCYTHIYIYIHTYYTNRIVLKWPFPKFLPHFFKNPVAEAKVLRRAVAEDQLQRLRLSIEVEKLRSFKARHGEARPPAEVQRRILGLLSVTGLGLSVIGWYWCFGNRKVEPKETFRHLTKITV